MLPEAFKKVQAWAKQMPEGFSIVIVACAIEDDVYGDPLVFHSGNADHTDIADAAKALVDEMHVLVEDAQEDAT